MAAVFVNGFDFDTPENIIENHFSGVGDIRDLRLIGKGSAVVTYSSPDEANRAVSELNETTMEGNRRYINVKIDGKGDDKGGKGKGKGKGKSSGGYGSRDRPQPQLTGQMQNGTVSSFFEERGFGFITPDDGGADAYVHFSAIQSDGFKTLHQGQAVRFEIGEDPKGKGKGKGKAVYVELL